LFKRHQALRDQLSKLYDLAGFRPKKDPGISVPGTCGGRVTSNRPADILVAGDSKAWDCVDVSIVSPISPNAANSQVEVGCAAREAEARKFSKHGPGCHSMGLGFSPFVVDIFGVLAPQAHKVLHRIVARLCSELGYPKYKAEAICYRRISTAIQIAVARQVLWSRAVVDLPDTASGLSP
jgi:hypothetical protein